MSQIPNPRNQILKTHKYFGKCRFATYKNPACIPQGQILEEFDQMSGINVNRPARESLNFLSDSLLRDNF